MPRPQSFAWIDPLDFTASLLSNPELDAQYFALLYSGVQARYSGRYSYIGFEPLEIIKTRTLASFKEIAATAPASALWFGYLGYGLKDGLEALPPDTPGKYQAENLLFVRYMHVIRFDHINKNLKVISGEYPEWVSPKTSHASTSFAAARITGSNMEKEEYISKVNMIIESIAAGEFYQANLTRKFYGEFAQTPDSFALFTRLAQQSPAAYSAYLRCGDICVLSSSPELFLAIDKKGNIRTRPIKGTSPRSSDPRADAMSKEALQNSAKDCAENLMIVDLMRNDLSRTCVPGSVETPALFEITSHAQVHHMSSTVTGRLKPGISIIDAIACSFPPGSMTGAPKIRAMQACTRLEQDARGIYSGAVGWLNNSGECELSVVIRTLILKGQYFEFQVGGGITHDSTPEGEWQETIDKSKGILSTLGLSAEEIAH